VLVRRLLRQHVNTSVVPDRAVSGSFTGSLAQVLSRLLEGHNYFIEWRASEINGEQAKSK
jgi:hypothetical protein